MPSVPARRMMVPALLALLLAAPHPARAQSWLLLDGLADGEVWATDSGSALLTRNDGHLSLAGRLQLFLGIEFTSQLQLLAVGELEGGKGTEEGKTEVAGDLAVLRLVASPLFVIDAGRFPTPVGTFAPRRFSDVNPLIGVPDGIPVTYPWGAQVGGSSSLLDYRVAVVSGPFTHEGQVPDAGRRLRPVVGAGITPATGIRFGVSFTRGSYLSEEANDSLPAGSDWTDFAQRVIGVDARFSRGYFEFHGEMVFGRFEVPTRSDPLDAVTYYGELKYTWTPRFYTALRLERNKFASIAPASGPWPARLIEQQNGEFGLGYRLGAKTLVKASYRRDRWPVPANLKAQYPSGKAFAFQLSQGFDLAALFLKNR